MNHDTTERLAHAWMTASFKTNEEAIDALLSLPNSLPVMPPCMTISGALAPHTSSLASVPFSESDGQAARFRKEDQFWKRIAIGAPDECWNWQGALSHGYGSLRIGGKTRYAHRVAFELSHRPLQAREHVMHSCDNPPCCNPNHLQAGSHADNMRDMANKGRSNGGSPGGSRQGTSKLIESQVIDIRREYNGSNRMELAQKYGVTPQAISYIIHKGWRHVNVS